MSTNVSYIPDQRGSGSIPRVRSVVKLGLSGRLVNVLPVPQPTKTLTSWRRRLDMGSLVVSSNLTSTTKK